MTINTILVTGSSGMIGTRLCERLMKMKYRLIGVDWKKNLWNEQIDNMTIYIDLRNKYDVLRLLPKGVDLIIHLAANARVYNLVIDPSQARDNFELTFNVLEFARINNINKIIFASSREVYGNTLGTTRSEEAVNIDNSESPYAASKIAAEALIWAYHKCYAIDFIIFRFSNVYGMYDETDRVIPLFIKEALQGTDLTVFGRDKIADFTYIDDTIDGIIKAIEKFDQSKNEVFNLACSQGVPIFKIAELIKSALNSKSRVITKENRIGELMRYIANISKARSFLGYDPTTTIEEGILKTIKWYLENGSNQPQIKYMDPIPSYRGA